MSTAPPLRAPPLTSIPSTPGPEFPGGYPRNSATFSTNQWDHSATEGQSTSGGLLAAAKAYLPAPKTFLPPAVASYFPDSSNTTSTPSTSSSTPTGSPAHTPGVALPTPGANSFVSDFSTRAYVGTGSSRGTTPLPTPGVENAPNPAAPPDANSNTTSQTTNTDASSAPRAPPDPSTLPVLTTAVTDLKEERPAAPPVKEERSHAPPVKEERSHAPPADPGVVPIPSVAPFASVLTSTGRKAQSDAPAPAAAASIPPTPPPKSPASPDSSNTNSSTSAYSAASATSTAPSSPSSPAHPKIVPAPVAHKASGSGLGARFASLRGHKREKSAPPSAFGQGHARGASLDAAAPAFSTSPVTALSATSSVDSTSPTSGADIGNGTSKPKPARRSSFLRTLRGEATLIAGKVRGDKERVERGRRMVAGEV